jgi:hypothetical protein
VGRREEIIPLGGATDWDADYHDPSWDPIPVGDELWVYYRSVNRRPGESNPNVGHAIGLATFRLDGFVSLNGGETPGTVLTRPLMFTGASLYVNASVADDGWVKAGVVSADGSSGEPCTLDESVPLAEDTTRGRMVWREASELRSLSEGEHIRLVFELRNAKLFSFWLE